MTGFLAVLWLVGIIVSMLISIPRGNAVIGFIVGLLLGPLGILVVLFISDRRPRCMHCKQLVEADDVICPHCRKETRLSRIPGR